MKNERRLFLRQMMGYTGSALILPTFLSACGSGTQANNEENSKDTTANQTTMETANKPLFFKISLAEWSLHKMLFDKKLDNLDFPAKAKNDFGIDAVEYVNQFFKDKAKDTAYLTELKKRTGDLGVTNVLIMIDGEGFLGSTDAKERMKAVENHYQWVEAAKFLGCHSIRVNAYGKGTAEEVSKAAIDGLGKLSEFAEKVGINVIVENHGSYSSDGAWLANVMKSVGKANCGTLPDFGNFCMKYKNDDWKQGCENMYDRYKGVEEMMPFAKGVSAKSNVFDAEGNEANMDYRRLLQIVKNAGYTGHIGIEYEGNELSEEEGVRATKKLLEKVGAELS
ncbi:sugar phosphate isomerase/epimerase family protein [Thermoflexibacter ruber]|uniref:Sugar phosphate isomerase/epimerase n=1 Tax=Thermoflexibacter ruber TaxID=1003 RepID=A0A1I2AGX8_9BACT|nr:Sugar phosphate isomerase/epimerase [Thermoflexibacter ruber]